MDTLKTRAPPPQPRGHPVRAGFRRDGAPRQPGQAVPRQRCLVINQAPASRTDNDPLDLPGKGTRRARAPAGDAVVIRGGEGGPRGGVTHHAQRRRRRPTWPSSGSTAARRVAPPPRRSGRKPRRCDRAQRRPAGADRWRSEPLGPATGRGAGRPTSTWEAALVDGQQRPDAAQRREPLPLLSPAKSSNDGNASNSNSYPVTPVTNVSALPPKGDPVQRHSNGRRAPRRSPPRSSGGGGGRSVAALPPLPAFPLERRRCARAIAHGRRPHDGQQRGVRDLSSCPLAGGDAMRPPRRGHREGVGGVPLPGRLERGLRRCSSTRWRMRSEYEKRARPGRRGAVPPGLLAPRRPRAELGGDRAGRA